MSDHQSSTQSRFDLKVQSRSTETFFVVAVDGQEAISQPYWFRVLFASSNTDLDADDFLQQPAMLKIFTSDGELSTQHSGLIFEFSTIKRVNDFVLYELVFRPRLWGLSFNRITDVYCEEQTIPEIIAKKLSLSGLTSLNFETRLKDPSVYRKRSFVCQFYETDLDFVSRYMEAEGIYYFFDQSEAFNEKLIMLDYQQGLPSNKKKIYYFDAQDMPTTMQDNRVTNLSVRKKIVQAKTVVQDFNYRKASLEESFKAEQEVDAKGIGSCMFWGYNLRGTNEAARVAKIRQEELSCEQVKVKGTSTAIEMRSGHFVTVEGYFQQSLNKDYLITSAKHEGRQSYAWLESTDMSGQSGATAGTTYTCEFEACDASLQYRARRSTQWPFIAGTLNGIVDDEGTGKYAQINEHGQYKVQLLYDLTHKDTNRGSCWIRMMTPYSGQGHGMAWPLLKGTEVIIGFMGGDPDQPLILGAVSNSENPNVLNANNSHLGGFQSNSGNYMVVNDKDGEQGVHMWSPGGNTHFYIGKF
jgi:type VI secretion system secreted protein VgrG